MESVKTRRILVFLVLIGVQSTLVSGHGRLIDPPSRASMWRYGFNNPPDYDDTASYCGGFSAQWEMNGGKCGVCGDRYDGPRDHEAGGKYANNIIVRHYRQGETITVKVDLTTSHLGYFEFRLCPNNNPTRRVTHQCLNRFLLRQPDGSTRYKIATYDQGVRSVRLLLPKGLTCSQCVLQWKYNAGNSWGCEGVGAMKTCCDGCGRQEQFYGCADVDITSASGTNGNQLPVIFGNSLNAGYNPDHTNPKNPGYGALIVNPPQYQSHNQHGVINPTLNSKNPYGQSSGLNQNPSNQYLLPNPQVSSLSNHEYFFGSSHNNNINNNYQFSASSYYSQCRGIAETLTNYCRRNCLSGSCSRIYCTEACQRLGLRYDQTADDGKDNTQQE